MPPCRDSFFSHSQDTKTGYSGVATFVRAQVSTPVQAEDGFTGARGMDRGEPAAASPHLAWRPAAAPLSRPAGGARRPWLDAQTSRTAPRRAGIRRATEGPPQGSLFEGFTWQQLEALDGEGRCVITDHGPLVILNVYGPAVCSDDERGEERQAFKMAFWQVSPPPPRKQGAVFCRSSARPVWTTAACMCQPPHAAL